MIRAEYDAIILGAGHNGLVLQAYLARSGLSTLSIDRAHQFGGGCYTVEDSAHPGFIHNTHSFFHRAISTMPWFSDLALEKHGVKYVHPDLNMSLILEDGRSFRWHLDVEEAASSLEKFSQKDADRLREISEEYSEVVEKIVGPMGCAPPMTSEKKEEILSRSTAGRRFLEAAAMSPREFCEKNFESDIFRAVLMYFTIIREFDVNEPGHGYLIPSLIASRRKAEICLGGSFNLARGLSSVISSNDGDILEQTEVSRIVIKNGKAAGVELKDHSVIKADIVASSLNPQQTFLQLMDASDLPDGLADRVSRYRYQTVGPLFAVNVALREAPDYTAGQYASELDESFLTMLGLQSPQEIYDLYNGRYPENLVLWGATPTRFDPSQAPPGHHTAFMWQKVPYALDGDPLNWEKRKESMKQAVLERWLEFAPNMTEDNILTAFATTPLDTERRLPNMVGGDLMVGHMGMDQSFDSRPFPGAGAYKSPIENLYLCGSCTHPGGNISGLPGYDAARVIIEDQAIKRWWDVIELEELWDGLRAGD